MNHADKRLCFCTILQFCDGPTWLTLFVVAVGILNVSPPGDADQIAMQGCGHIWLLPDSNTKQLLLADSNAMSPSSLRKSPRDETETKPNPADSAFLFRKFRGDAFVFHKYFVFSWILVIVKVCKSG